MSPGADDPVLPFASQAEWAAWLEREHASADGVWVKLAKKGSGIPSVTYAEAVEAALAYGWIDGQMRSVDERFYIQRFTPRRARSRWSRLNRERALELIARGEMKPAGMHEVERAQADGRWDEAYASPTQAAVPDDLRQALAEDEAARAAFEGLDGRNRYALLHQIEAAKRPETRARRIAKFVAMLRAGEKLYP